VKHLRQDQYGLAESEQSLLVDENLRATAATFFGRIAIKQGQGFIMATSLESAG